MKTLIKASLWLTAPLNLAAASGFANPSSWLGALLGLPTQAHPLYSLFSGGMIGLFGFAYLWLAISPGISRPLLFVGACGKSFAAVLALTLFVADALPLTTAALMGADLLFASLWFYFLATTPARAES